ncbi:GNAT acetyltransferase 2 domain-containing protein [Apiospora aurea]|uniref:RNA cytidine acetyltransferase n=1 Tax=Apiospora aurea TaxID=335848 RepID=A0ABR1QPI8_9PEZI
MGRKAVDSRIPALIRNGLQEKKRSFFVVVGDHSKECLVHLHYIMSSMDLKTNKSVLWAYQKKLLGFTSHRQKRESKIKKDIKRGVREANAEDPFELFVTLNDISYRYYKDSDKILGQTFGMVVLQDFEGITPNLLAKTIETVEGGGLVVLLLKGMTSLRQLYNLSMDVHNKYRTEAHQDVVARFNERFLLSLGDCESCLVIDDELNVLPISGGKGVKPLPPPDLDQPKTETELELDAIKEQHQEGMVLGPLVKLAKTVDQAKALLTFVEAANSKTLRETVTLTAARGRGKSAAMGIAIASAIAYGYSNIFITSPSPENLKTLFQFIFKGFDALGYGEHSDYSIMQSTNPDFNKAIVRVNIFRQHRQTIQYIRPQDAHVLGQAELLVIDEAAAIPLPVVRKLMGPYLVFMASTINGYEGTGRSLSLKLIKQLREQSRAVATSSSTEVADRSSGKASKSEHQEAIGGRSLREITLATPIRYAQGDPTEKWLNTLLCLDATLPRTKINITGCPDPAQCQLLYVNRDTLFSFHKVSEKFLQQMVSLYVASHYKNSPDDLQLMSDAPSHELFVLTAPITKANQLPEPLVVIQVALEGKISRESVLNSLSRGTQAAGDLIPWTLSRQFQDENFASLSGARIVRIAASPDYASMGYGSRALELLVNYYEGKFMNLSEDGDVAMEETMERTTAAELVNANLLDDDIKVRDISKMPPLFSKLEERRNPALDYVGVSYGLTHELLKFWKRSKFVPVYLRQTSNDLTGENTCIMLRTLENADDRSWLGAFAKDFQNRFMTLLSYNFRSYPSVLSLVIDESASAGAQLDPTIVPRAFTKSDLDNHLSPFDLKRLDSYASGLLDWHVIMDLLPTIATLYFTGRIKSHVNLGGVQQAILMAVGLQRKDVEDVAQELKLQVSQVMAMLIKIMRKMMTYFQKLVAGAVEADMPQANSMGVSAANADSAHDDKIDVRFNPLEKSLDEELEEAGDETTRAMKQQQRELIDSLPLNNYEIEDSAPGWDEAEKQVATATKRGQSNPVVSVKSSKAKRKDGPSAAEIYEEEFGDKKAKKAKKSKKSH